MKVYVRKLDNILVYFKSVVSNNVDSLIATVTWFKG